MFGWVARIMMVVGLLAAMLSAVAAGMGRAMGRGDWIAYSQNVIRGDAQDLFLLDANRLQRVHLTRGSSDDFEPAWSPDGGRLAYTAIAHGISQIHVLSLNGDPVLPLPDLTIHARSANWSPDGRWLGFLTMDTNGGNVVAMFDLTTGETRTLGASGSERRPTLWSPVWSPDSTGLAFVASQMRTADIFVLQTETDVQRRLTEFGTNNRPAWSPDGRRLAFDSDQNGDNDIYVLTVDTGQVAQLTDEYDPTYWPVWSPDGRRLAYISERNGNREVYLMNADGTRAQNLTQDSAQDFQPAWMPDGWRLVFRSTRDSASDLYVMDDDGTNVHRLTFTTAGQGALGEFAVRP